MMKILLRLKDAPICLLKQVRSLRKYLLIILGQFLISGKTLELEGGRYKMGNMKRSNC